MTDWTLILTSVGTSAVAGSLTGWFVYLGAKRSGAVALRGVEAENERLREQHREDHFRHRQGVYHDFLDVDRALMRRSPRVTEMPMEEIEALFVALEHTYNAVLLFGTPAVIGAAETLIERWGEVSDRGEELDDEAWEHRVSIAVDELRGELIQARTDLVRAMRDDVGHR
jgi:hypothetical protein